MRRLTLFLVVSLLAFAPVARAQSPDDSLRVADVELTAAQGAPTLEAAVSSLKSAENDATAALGELQGRHPEADVTAQALSTMTMAELIDDQATRVRTILNARALIIAVRALLILHQ